MDDPAKGVDELSRLGPGIANVTKETPKNGSCCRANLVTRLGQIKELILPSQITGWDPYFNAITGLNGSGKSNILDVICFVLGLTNMSSVRVPHHLL
jgi:hypothetical protein